MTSPRSARPPDSGAPDPPRCMPTKAMKAMPTAPRCGGVGSGPGSPGVEWSPRPGVGATAGGAELLQAAAGALGSRFGAVVRVRPAGLRGRLLQPALTSRTEGHDSSILLSGSA